MVATPAKLVRTLAFAAAVITLAGCTPGGNAPTSSSFTDQFVMVGSEPWQLPGTLALPTGQGPFAAVVLVQGSGPSDRDETIGHIKPFKDIAGYLASNGIAALRYDKRTLVYRSKYLADKSLLSMLTVREETTDDAQAAVDMLGHVRQVDPKRIFVLGHSLGGYLAPRIVAGRPSLRGYISAEGAALPLQDLYLKQLQYIGGSSPSGQMTLAIEQAKAWKAEIDAGNLPLDMPPSQWPLGVPPGYWLDLHGYDPVKSAAALPQPLLVLQGENDYQVTLDDFAAWKTGLAGRVSVTFHSYPDVDHGMIDVSTKSTQHDYDQAAHVDARYMSDIAKWIKSI